MTKLQLLVFLVIQMLTASALAAPTKCDDSWFARNDETFGVAEAAQVCLQQDLLTSDNVLLCADKKAAYLKAFEAVCPLVKAGKFEQSKKEDRLTLYKLYLANGAPLRTRQPDAAGAPGAAASPAATAAAPNAISGSEEGVVASPIAGMVAQGLADFLVKRGEAEIALFATDEFFSTLCKDATVSKLFPTTCALMKDKDGETSSDPPSLGTLRAALVKDLHALPKAFVVELAKSADPKTKILGCSLDVGLALGQGLRENQDPWVLLTTTTLSPPDGLYVYATDPTDCATEWQAIEKLAGQLSALRGSPQGGVSPAFQALTRGNAAGAKALQAGAGVPAAVLGRLARVFAVNAQMASAGIKDEGIREIAEALFKAVAEGVKLARCKSDADCIAAVDQGRDIALDVTEGQWSEAAMAFLTAGELDDVIFKSAPKLRGIIATVAAVAEAQDSDGVKAALEHYAAPVGSWRGKHEASGFGLVGMAGASWAHENVLKSSADGGTLNPTLAAGFDLYTPFISRMFRIGLFFPVIDVGNYASVRYDPGSADDVVHAKTEAQIGVAQLFAPGAYAFISLGKSPFTLGGGCSWIPSLRTVVDANGSTDRAVVRCGGMLAIDVTIMPLVKF